jgi:hypothetical protein
MVLLPLASGSICKDNTIGAVLAFRHHRKARNIYR